MRALPSVCVIFNLSNSSSRYYIDKSISIDIGPAADAVNSLVIRLSPARVASCWPNIVFFLCCHALGNFLGNGNIGPGLGQHEAIPVPGQNSISFCAIRQLRLFKKKDSSSVAYYFWISSSRHCAMASQLSWLLNKTLDVVCLDIRTCLINPRSIYQKLVNIWWDVHCNGRIIERVDKPISTASTLNRL